jgi:uncharacterized protein (TIGR00730 family)
LYTTHNPAIDAKLSELAAQASDPLDQTLLRELLVSVYRLGQDGASTGDLKIINTALKELRYAFTVFGPYRHVRKVAVFGSARVRRQHPSYAMAAEFGRLIAKAGWAVITGAASGIMRAGHEGAGRDASFGLNIRLPFEQEANPVIASDKKLVTCKYFFTRKLLFIKESHATVLFPGGFGTLDEGFECLTLMQTGKADPRPIVFVEQPGNPYWKPLLDFIDGPMCRQKMISDTDRSLYQVAHSAQEAADRVLSFYRVYHSMRYVGPRLVMRLQQPLSASALARLNRDFADMLSGGLMEVGRALPEESEEPQLSKLARLIIPFDRRSYGQLLQLISAINQRAR